MFCIVRCFLSRNSADGHGNTGVVALVCFVELRERFQLICTLRVVDMTLDSVPAGLASMPMMDLQGTCICLSSRPPFEVARGF